MKELYTQLVSSLIFPAHEWLKRHDTLAVRRDMEQSQWLSPPELHDLQLARLRVFLGYVGRHVPYYRSLFSEIDFDPDTVESLNDLRRLPMLTKDSIRENLRHMKADNTRGLSRFNTGGSTGEPLLFYLSKERVSHDVAGKWRATRWWNVDIGDPEIVVWGSPVELGTQDHIRSFRDRVFRTKLLPAFEMSDKNVGAFIEAIRADRPKMLFGYPSAINHIASHAIENNIAMDALGVKVAFVTAERLYGDQRRRIEHVFGCRVANGYGGRDAGFIAHECPDGGMHITAEDVIVEIINPAGEVLPRGQAGEIVITHLATKGFPFIRYRTGDIGVLDNRQCPCGRGLPLFEEVQGRTTDFIVAADGTVMHGLALIYVLREIAGISSFKIIQESLHDTRVLLVTNASFRPSDLDNIRINFRKRLGGQVRIDIELVSVIPPERSGKYRHVVSHVQSSIC